jgi:hypothetical protein
LPERSRCLARLYARKGDVSLGVLLVAVDSSGGEATDAHNAVIEIYAQELLGVAEALRGCGRVAEGLDQGQDGGSAGGLDLGSLFFVASFVHFLRLQLKFLAFDGKLQE